MHWGFVVAIVAVAFFYGCMAGRWSEAAEHDGTAPHWAFLFGLAWLPLLALVPVMIWVIGRREKPPKAVAREVER